MPGQLLLHAIRYRSAFKEGLRAPRSGRDRMENANAKWSWPQHHYSLKYLFRISLFFARVRLRPKEACEIIRLKK